MALSAQTMKALIKGIRSTKKKISSRGFSNALEKKLGAKGNAISEKQIDRLLDEVEKKQHGLEARDTGIYNRTYNGSKRKKRNRKRDRKESRQEAAFREEKRKKALAMITSNSKHIPSSIDWGYDAWDVK